MNTDFGFGIEEEYFLADGTSGKSPDGETADRFHEAAEKRVEPASHELLKGQVEIQTKPGTSFDEAHQALKTMRHDLSEIAGDNGLLLLASGTHPLATARQQEASDGERYQRLDSALGITARRSMVCAMHIHVEAPDPDRRIGLMNRMVPFLPLLFALSVSSPFWQGRPSGLMAFRLTAFSEWPRSGVPDLFSGEDDYRRYIDLLVAAGVMENASFVWWYIRPSNKFPTIELRVCDSCTRAEDAVAIAALYQALMRMLSRRPDVNADIGPVDRGVAESNIWHAQKHGLKARLIDVGRKAAIPVSEALDEALALVGEDADALGSTEWVARTRRIADRASSAERQISAFEDAKGKGRSDEEALRGVVRMLAEDTLA